MRYLEPGRVLTPLLILFVALADVSSPATTALARATEQVVGSGLRVEVRGVAPPVAQGELEEQAKRAGAAALARLDWQDNQQTRATIHARVLATGETLERTVVFRPSDSSTDRGRALGFILGSFMLPPSALPPESSTNPVVRSDEVPPPPAPTRHLALEGFAIGGLAVGGVGDGLGGGAGVRWPADAAWGLRLGARARVGTVTVAQASLLAVHAYAGLFANLLTGQQSQPWLTARADLLLGYESLSHFSDDDDQPVRQGRFLPGAAATLELPWRLAPAATLFVAGGIEAIFGRTAILVHQVQVAELAPFRLIAEAGFQARF